jgi:hypothetical protein
MTEPRHPLQPLIKDDRGVIRFKANAIVRFLLDNGPHNLNHLAVMNFSAEDHEQFAQLIGYSLSGFGDLDYVRNETYEAAAQMEQAGLDERDARISALQETVGTIKKALREMVPAVFNIHPDSLE